MAMVAGTVPVGANSPQRVDVTLTSIDIDLSTVTSCTWGVSVPGGTIVTWSNSIVSQSTTTLVTRHTFAAADTTTYGDGLYVIKVSLTIGGSTFPTNAVALRVTPLYLY